MPYNLHPLFPLLTFEVEIFILKNRKRRTLYLILLAIGALFNFEEFPALTFLSSLQSVKSETLTKIRI